MSKKITVEITEDCEDEIIISSLKEMREILMDMRDIDAFELVIKFYEGVQ